jgi:hypothetical protein
MGSFGNRKMAMGPILSAKQSIKNFSTGHERQHRDNVKQAIIDYNNSNKIVRIFGQAPGKDDTTAITNAYEKISSGEWKMKEINYVKQKIREKDEQFHARERRQGKREIPIEELYSKCQRSMAFDTIDTPHRTVTSKRVYPSPTANIGNSTTFGGNMILQKKVNIVRSESHLKRRPHSSLCQ